MAKKGCTGGIDTTTGFVNNKPAKKRNPPKGIEEAFIVVSERSGIVIAKFATAQLFSEFCADTRFDVPNTARAHVYVTKHEATFKAALFGKDFVPGRHASIRHENVIPSLLHLVD